jgi:hypothetical protein
MMTVTPVRLAIALLISLVLFDRTPSIAQPVWTRFENNFGDSIIDKELRIHGLSSDDVGRSSSAFEKFTLIELRKAGLLRTSDALTNHLQLAGMACADATASKHTCRMSRHMVERLDSGGPEDGTSHIDWEVFISWDGDLDLFHANDQESA